MTVEQMCLHDGVVLKTDKEIFLKRVGPCYFKDLEDMRNKLDEELCEELIECLKTDEEHLYCSVDEYHFMFDCSYCGVDLKINYVEVIDGNERLKKNISIDVGKKSKEKLLLSLDDFLKIKRHYFKNIEDLKSKVDFEVYHWLIIYIFDCKFYDNGDEDGSVIYAGKFEYEKDRYLKIGFEQRRLWDEKKIVLSKENIMIEVLDDWKMNIIARQEGLDI